MGLRFFHHILLANVIITHRGWCDTDQLYKCGPEEWACCAQDISLVAMHLISAEISEKIALVRV
jgi:hypothetical protein